MAKVMHPCQLASTVVVIIKHFKLNTAQQNSIIRYIPASGYWHAIIINKYLVNHKLYNQLWQPPLRKGARYCLAMARMDESADARIILTAVPQSDWRRSAGRPHTSWLATMKNDLSNHNLSAEDAISVYTVLKMTP